VTVGTNRDIVNGTGKIEEAVGIMGVLSRHKGPRSQRGRNGRRVAGGFKSNKEGDYRRAHRGENDPPRHEVCQIQSQPDRMQRNTCERHRNKTVNNRDFIRVGRWEGESPAVVWSAAFIHTSGRPTTNELIRASGASSAKRTRAKTRHETQYIRCHKGPPPSQGEIRKLESKKLSTPEKMSAVRGEVGKHENSQGPSQRKCHANNSALRFA